MTETKAGRRRRATDPWRGKLAAWVKANPGVTVGAACRAWPQMTRGRVWALLSSAVSRGELAAERDDRGALRFYDPETAGLSGEPPGRVGFALRVPGAP